MTLLDLRNKIDRLIQSDTKYADYPVTLYCWFNPTDIEVDEQTNEIVFVDDPPQSN